MRFRFDEIEKDDLKAINGNLYLRVNNQWYLFVKSIKGYNFETEYGEGVFSVTDSEGFRHVFFTKDGIYKKPNNVEAVMGNFVNVQYLWEVENLVENSENAEKLFDNIRETLKNMNSEAELLKSVNKHTSTSEYIFDLPEPEETEETEETSDEPDDALYLLRGRS